MQKERLEEPSNRLPYTLWKPSSRKERIIRNATCWKASRGPQGRASGTCSSFLPLHSQHSLTRGGQETEDPIQEALQTQEAQCTAAQDQQGCAPSKEGV